MKNFAQLMTLLKNITSSIGKVRARYQIGGGAVIAGVIAGVFITLGFEPEQSISVSVAVVSTIIMLISLFKPDVTAQPQNSGEVKYWRVSADIDAYKAKRKTGVGQITWYVKDPPITHEAAKRDGWKVGVDESGNVYDIESGMIIGEIAKR